MPTAKAPKLSQLRSNLFSTQEFIPQTPIQRRRYGARKQGEDHIVVSLAVFALISCCQRTFNCSHR